MFKKNKLGIAIVAALAMPASVDAWKNPGRGI